MKRVNVDTGADGEEPKRQRVAPSDEELQLAVKVGQRVSPEWKDTWHSWCDDQSRGRPVYDPAKYSGPELIQFFKTVGNTCRGQIGNPGFGRNMSQNMNMGRQPAPMMSARGGARQNVGAGGSDRDAQQLVALVKAGQRACPEWKEAWVEFCTENAGGMNDPNRQSNNPIFFLAFLFRFGLGTLGSQDWAQPFMGSIAAVATPVIVQAIKLGQKQSSQWKDAWVDYCDTNGHRFHDPSRHDASSLFQFMDTVGITKFQNEPWMEAFVTGCA